MLRWRGVMYSVISLIGGLVVVATVLAGGGDGDRALLAVVGVICIIGGAIGLVTETRAAHRRE